MEGIDRRFGEVVALDGAHLTVDAGEVHGVLGENGAGKTTLLEILGGLLRPDAGTVRVAGRPVELPTPRHAWARGIGMVHQHFTLVPRLTVLENLVLGTRSRMGGLGLPLGDIRERARRLMERTGLEVELDARVETLGVGRQQRVELLKVLLRDPRVLVLDEPTAVLAPPEVEGLLELLGWLADDGRAVVLVAHKLDEVLGVADRVTVFRDGRTVLEAPRGRVDAPMLARAMVGRDVTEVVGAAGRGGGSAEGEPVPAPRPVAHLRGVGVEGSGGRSRLTEVDLEVRRGEIVGVAGVEGNGQRELARVLAGRRAPDRGRAHIPAEPGFIPQDRRSEGLIADFDLVENVALALHRKKRYTSVSFLRWGEIRKSTERLVERFGVRAPDTGSRARELSGGNQQRLVVARELHGEPDLLVAENPSRGLDVAGEAYVHRQLLRLRERSPAPGVVLISTDLDEILALSDRIFVMVRGRLTAVPDHRRTREDVGELMLGGAER